MVKSGAFLEDLVQLAFTMSVRVKNYYLKIALSAESIRSPGSPVPKAKSLLTPI